MEIGSIPFQKELLQQIVSQTGIVDKKQRQNLKLQLDRKYSRHINLIQYHQLREDRFILSQKKVLEKQHISIEKTKEYIKLRQDKAHYNKNTTLIEKSKRVESDLSRWERIVDKNRDQHEKKLKESLHFIEKWNEKLSQSTSRKSLRLNNVSKTLQERSHQRLSKANSHRKYVEDEQESKIKNLQKDNSRREAESRYTNNPENRKNSRVSTESMHYRNKKEQSLLEKSLVKAGQKNEKINQARYMRQFLLQKKSKNLQEKEDSLKKVRQHRLNSIKQQVEDRNDILDQKFKNDRVKARNKRGSLPSVLGSKAASILFLNGPGEEWRGKNNLQINQFSPSQPHLASQQALQERSKEWLPKYDRIIVEKLRNVALLVRKGKKI